MVQMGKIIKEKRIAKGYTQVQLGKLLNVSTQAVSKWERGGAPDIELLPEIADVLGISMDALFGREEKSVEKAIARELKGMPLDEAFRRAYKMCWAINAGLAHEESLIHDSLDNIKYKDTDHKYFSIQVMDQGILSMRLAEDFRTFFFMPEPQGGLQDKLASMEDLQKVFSVFSDMNVLKIIFYMYSRLNTPIDASLISKNTGIDEDVVEEYMKLLENTNLVDIRYIETAKGNVAAYTFRNENAVVPFLCIADEICKKLVIDYWVQFERTKPLFY